MAGSIATQVGTDGTPRWLCIPLILSSWFIPESIRGEFVVLNSGSIVEGRLVSLDDQQVHFHASDGRTLDLSGKEVFGIFADDTPRKLLKPGPEAKAELRMGSTTIAGRAIVYDPHLPFIFYASAGKARIALVRAEDKLRYLKLGSFEALETVDRGPALGKDALKAMKGLSKDNLPMAIQLGDTYLKLRPSGNEREEAEVLLGALRKAWKEKVKEYFKIVTTETSLRSDNREPLFTYHIFSKLDSFSDLRCRVWIQMSDNDLYSGSFTYFTLKKANRHHDTVQVKKAKASLRNWRVELVYHGEVAALKESEPAGPSGWWNGESSKLVYWGEKDNQAKDRNAKDKAPDKYFSRTLGKVHMEEDEEKAEPVDEE
jgi:hypothetical protein